MSSSGRAGMRLALPLLIAVLGHQVAMAQQKGRRPGITFKVAQPPLAYEEPVMQKPTGLELPDNATSIRENIVDTFSCDERIYGYYADIDNECQIFHVCLPQLRNVLRFSFICPAETVFNQATFVCTRAESSIPCAESEKYYALNEQLGELGPEETATEIQGNELEPPAGVAVEPPVLGGPRQRPATRRPGGKPARLGPGPGQHQGRWY